MVEGFSQRPLKKEQQDSREKTRAEVRLEEMLERVKKGDDDRDSRRAVDEFDIDSFCPPFTHTELARKLIESSEAGRLLLVKNLSIFEGPDHNDIARRLFEKGSGRIVARYFSNFEGVDHADTAHRLIKEGYFEGLDTDVAHWLTKKGSGRSVVEHPYKFKGADHVDTAHRLIKEGYGEFVVEHLSDFKGVDHIDTAHRLIKKGYGDSVAEHLSNFEGLDHVDIAHRLIEEGDGDSVAEHLSNFKGVDHVDIAHRLIEFDGGSGWSVPHYLSNFRGVDHTDIAHRLIKEGYGEIVAEYLSSFEGLGADIARWLIEKGHGESVVEYLSSFEGSDHTDIAHRLIETGKGGYVASNLSNFEGLDHADIARRLIEKGYGEFVAQHLSNFKGVDHTDIARRLIESRDEWYLARNLSAFKGLDADIARRLIEKGHGFLVAEYLSNFKGMGHADIAHRLIEKGYGDSVAQHLSDFEGLDHTDIAHRLIEAGYGKTVARHLSNFEGLDHTDIAHRLIEAGKGVYVASNLPDFKGLGADMARRLIEEGYGKSVAEHLSKFEGLGSDTAHRLIEKGHGESVAQHLSDFEGLDHVDIAHRLIEGGYGKTVAQHLSNFEGLDHTDIAHRLIEAGHGESVAQHFHNFKGVDHADIANRLIQEGYGKYLPDFGKVGFHESDPYERHPWRLTEEQAKAASVFSKLLSGDAVDEETLREVGIDRGRIEPLLERVNGKIEAAHQEFLEKVRDPLDWRSNLQLTKDQREEILNPPVRLRPLPDVIRSFVARYLVQMAQGFGSFASDTLIDGLDSLLEKGFRSYVQAYTVDIPLYDKLYDEYDNLRDAGRYPLEVYVGRDGIYAWIGRRVQDVARRRKMGREKRMEMKEKGEILEINPKYIVYPRYFRDNMKYEVKRKLLEQEGVSPDADPLFYDTGYVGTILEQMMRIMEFDEEEIDRRMRLLSAKTASRRVRGIPDNRRDDIVERIEGNAKPEETAEGLIVDKETGKIRHIAKPVPPDQFFNFMMIKQAISRHYWTKDHLHREQSGNANFDSERHTIRIREAYKDALPEELFVNPDGFLDGQTMFTARDGRDIIVETVQPKKMKEAQQEFSVLVTAKKAGLPVAPPVGIISEKGGGGGYVLVEKLEGHRGQNFEKWLRESGSFSEEKVKEIMSDVRNRYRSVAGQFEEKIDVNIGVPHADNYVVDFDEEAGEVRSVTPVNWM